MLYLSRSDIEHIAGRITADYTRLPQFDGQGTDRIDPYTLAHDLLGLSIDHYRLSKNGAILGLTANSEVGVEVYGDNGEPCIYYLDGKTLLVEKELVSDPAQRGRYNFTVLHEVAHQILDRMAPQEQGGCRCRVMYYRGIVQQHPSQDWGEWQADNMASALLLPAFAVNAALSKFGLEGGFDILNRIYRPKEYQRFCDMAEYLGASKQALAIRLRRLGLLKTEYLRNPQAMVDVEKDGDG